MKLTKPAWRRLRAERIGSAATAALTPKPRSWLQREAKTSSLKVAGPICASAKL